MSYAAHRKGGPSACARCRDPPPDDTERASLSEALHPDSPRGQMAALPYPDSLREKHQALANITPRTIAYPIRICCPDHWLATAHVPPPSDGVSGRPVRTSFAVKTEPELNLGWKRASLPWIPKNSPQSRIALVIKKLSKHQNLIQFD